MKLLHLLQPWKKHKPLSLLDLDIWKHTSPPGEITWTQRERHPEDKVGPLSFVGVQCPFHPGVELMR